MKKQGLIIFGSPHKNGFTANVLKNFLTSLNESYEFSFIDCYKKNVHSCIACEFCKLHDGCIYDDMDDIDRLLKTVDIIIFASPTYNSSVPSPMKAVFDRMQRYYHARFFRNIKPVIPKKKDGVLIMTCGSKDDFGTTVIKRQVKLVCSIINCNISKEIIVDQTDSKLSLR